MAYEYTGLDATITLAGKVGVACRMVSVSLERSQTDHYRLGSANPHTITKAPKAITGELELYHSEYEALMRSLPAGSDLSDIRGAVIAIALEAGSLTVPAVETITDVSIGGFSKEYSASEQPVTVRVQYRGRALGFV